ncbi:hypothetical protein VNO77_04313 [Canavalia gladiata]|uniref:Uncharacterized protein n=1 Tax=Canavalia gladiata TaxID=3824 RepID=A0AAN9R7N4_CANGL
MGSLPLEAGSTLPPSQWDFRVEKINGGTERGSWQQRIVDGSRGHTRPSKLLDAVCAMVGPFRRTTLFPSIKVRRLSWIMKLEVLLQFNARSRHLSEIHAKLHVRIIRMGG